MSGKRKSYASAYRREAARLVIDTGRSIAVVARELGVGEALLGRWVGVERSRMDVVPAAFDADERAELERLRVENAELRFDREFVKMSRRHIGGGAGQGVADELGPVNRLAPAGFDHGHVAQPSNGGRTLCPGAARALCAATCPRHRGADSYHDLPMRPGLGSTACLTSIRSHPRRLGLRGGWPVRLSAM